MSPVYDLARRDLALFPFPDNSHNIKGEEFFQGFQRFSARYSWMYVKTALIKITPTMAKPRVAISPGIQSV
jgi:hypothetical protein